MLSRYLSAVADEGTMLYCRPTKVTVSNCQSIIDASMPTLQEILSLRAHCLDSEPYSQERKQEARKVVGQPRNISSFLEDLSYPWLTNCKIK